ncbi:hypothetical protein HY494_02030 [Candidatus Woesearchaeota archaeon]|nr:hypothetical protein [Candidatus Woesearchaeota archaeon]
MSKLALSDEEIYLTLEKVIDTIALRVPVDNPGKPSFPDKGILEQLQQQKYSPKMSWAFLCACYWHLTDHHIMIVDPSLRYSLTERITENKKTDICMEIFSEYEPFLKANYARSLIEPNPYIVPNKVPDNSAVFQPKVFSAGK